jgi:nitrite reductase/ring-hydroxylating ferredoxin subunit
MATEVLVCREQEMADGAVRIVRQGELEVAVIRQAGRFYAYRNLCAHQGGPACEGVRMPRVIDVIDKDGFFTGQEFDHDDMRIVCPWHGYEYHLDTGVNVCDSRIRLKKYEVSERDGAIYVSL